MHITHTSFEICDPYESVLKVLNVHEKARINRIRVPPHCWLEDAGGNTQGTFEFTSGFFNFELVKSDGSKVLDARLAIEGGVRQMLKDFASKRYEIDLFDPTFSALMLAGTIAAMDTVLM